MGDYIGVLPCADCMGIFTHLKIKENGKYEGNSYYLGRSKEYESRSGEFEWHSDGNNIRLDDGTKFQVREMELAMLAADGGHIGGMLTDHYLLAKSDVGPLLGDPPEAVLNRSWEVYRLIDEGVEFERKYRPGFKVNEEGKLFGQTQCNGFETAVDFSVTQGFQPGKMAISKRACSKMKQEAKFIRAFGESKYYLVFSNQLLLLDNDYKLLLIAIGEE
jgi:heat shock protein HslJ